MPFMPPSTAVARAAGRAVAVGLAVAMLSVPGAARAAKESFGYAPPTRAPKGELTRYVDEGEDAVFEQVWAFLEQQRQFAIESVNPQDRIIVARYSGDPRPYLDCGVVTLLVDGQATEPPKRYSANKPEVRTAKSPKGRRYGLLRRLRLDARLVVRVEPRGKGARVYADAIYVASKTVNRIREGGRRGALIDREVISFTSDRPGKFEKGTVCIGTGRLESVPVNLFKRTS
jgi:hypothetical protein